MCTNNKKNCFYFNLGTFNVRGLTSITKQKQLEADLESYKLDLLCIQETKIKLDDDIECLTANQNKFVFFKSECAHYGNGFLIHSRLVDKVKRYWRENDRICVIQFEFENVRDKSTITHNNVNNVFNSKENRKHNVNNVHDSKENGTNEGKSKSRSTIVTVINVYGPTSSLTYKNPELRDHFFSSLQTVLDKVNDSSIALIAGDFNSKVGKFKEGDLCLGKYSRGHRNANGEALVEFCESNNLFVSNSAFQKAARNITTWVGTRVEASGKVVKILNQIDFIICKQNKKHLLTDAQSYGGTIVSSDHKLVKSVIKIDPFNLWKNKSDRVVKKEYSQLTTNKSIRDDYREQLEKYIKQSESENLVEKQWENVKSAINLAAEKSLGNVVPNSKINKQWDQEIKKLSETQKDLRITIQNTSDPNKIASLKKERNYVLHKIRKRACDVRNQELDALVEDIDLASSDSGMFKAVKLLNKKPFENPSVKDDTGATISNPNKVSEIVSKYFEEKFRDSNSDDIQSFEGEPKTLNNPISKEEVRACVNKLNNGKAPGDDEITGEYLKYGPEILDQTIADIFNKVFENHDLLDINNGVIIALQKPGKPKGPPKNLRPITLLTTLRKTLSLIVLNRIRPKIEKYLSHSQGGFRPERSTSDAVWAHRWIAAKTCLSKTEIKITGLDMSAAFDTINREKLLTIISDIVDEDELRIIRFLLSNTTLRVKINGATYERTFIGNTGTPQGDSLSPILFAVYLEFALRDARIHIDSPPQSLCPHEIIYADDTDFIGKEFIDVSKIQETLKEYNLVVNVDKTELTTISRQDNSWKSVKKLGSLLGDKEDIENRKRLSTAALFKLRNVWLRNNKVKQSTAIKLYRALVKSVLLYNSATWGLTQADEEKLDTFHRKQLKYILKIKYPQKISNNALYQLCNETPLSLQILEARWKLLGHILRRDQEIPANKAINFYFSKSEGEQYRGRPITTLPVTLHNDLKRVQNKLKTIQDLEKLKLKAADRKQWKNYCTYIRKAAEAARSNKSEKSKEDDPAGEQL